MDSETENKLKKVLCNGSNPSILGRTENKLETNFRLKENACIIILCGLEILTICQKAKNPKSD
tara:strand:- start:233 stop:421 length:189 start_codon:yes stop_codon:yes gene_type:complete